MLHNTSILWILANVRQFLVAVTLSRCATRLPVYMTIRIEVCFIFEHHSAEKKIIVSCIQHQICKVNCFLPICISAMLLDRRFREGRPGQRKGYFFFAVESRYRHASVTAAALSWGKSALLRSGRRGNCKA
jgi:hypothetical protein